MNVFVDKSVGQSAKLQGQKETENVVSYYRPHDHNIKVNVRLEPKVKNISDL